MTPAGVRFGVVAESVAVGTAWLDHARRVEDAGVDVLLVRDHFTVAPFGPQPAPFTALAAAATVTSRLTVGTMVLSNDYRHPVLVAHEAATLHALSGGRFELGLGAGWYRPEYEAAGIPFDSARVRVDRLEESLTVLEELLGGGRVDHVGASYRTEGPTLDVVPGRSGRPPAAFERIELSAFATFVRTDRRRAATEDLLARRGWTGVDVAAVWEMPTVFVGSIAQMREDVLARWERFGLSYLVASDRDLPVLAEVVGGW